MAEFTDREHYIPLRQNDLVELLLRQPGMSDGDRQQFRQFCTLVSATYHFEYYQKLQELKNEYAPFDPDAATTSPVQLTAGEKQQKLDGLFQRFGWLMERANFQHLDRQAIIEAMNVVSDWGLNMQVDFSVFERLEVYTRGDTLGKRTRRRWWRLFRKETLELPVFQRMALILKLRPHKRLGRGVDTAAVFLKLFKDIPKMDLEMLLPGARLQMPGLARLKLGGSFLGGLGFIVYKILTELYVVLAIGFWAFWGPIAAILGYGYKQWYGYQTTKTTYSLQLTQSLYFQNLDNNAGVLNHLLDEAEEQECREAILGYYYLWRHAGEKGWTSAELDDFIEAELERLAGIKVDFEIDDALAKLEHLQIVTKDGDRYRARPVAKALEMLDWTWDNYFKFSNPEPETPPVL